MSLFSRPPVPGDHVVLAPSERKASQPFDKTYTSLTGTLQAFVPETSFVEVCLDAPSVRALQEIHTQREQEMVTAGERLGPVEVMPGWTHLVIDWEYTYLLPNDLDPDLLGAVRIALATQQARERVVTTYEIRSILKEMGMSGPGHSLDFIRCYIQALKPWFCFPNWLPEEAMILPERRRDEDPIGV